MANFDDIPLLENENKSNDEDNHQSLGDLDDDAMLAADFENMKIEEQPHQEEIQQIEQRATVTKEDLQFTPVPIFDCIFCVKDSHQVFQTESEKVIHKLNKRLDKKMQMKKKIEQE